MIFERIFNCLFLTTHIGKNMFPKFGEVLLINLIIYLRVVFGHLLLKRKARRTIDT